MLPLVDLFVSQVCNGFLEGMLEPFALAEAKATEEQVRTQVPA